MIMADKIVCNEWKKIIETNTNKFAIVTIGDGEVALDVEVTRSIPLSEQLMLIDEVMDACAPVSDSYKYDETTNSYLIDLHRNVRAGFLCPAFRACVLAHYTNLDVASNDCSLDDIWGLIGNDKNWYGIIGEITDDIEQMYYDIQDRVNMTTKYTDKMFGRILAALDSFDLLDFKGKIEDIVAQIEALDGNNEILQYFKEKE